MSFKYLGIDPGKSGAWAVINEEAEIVQYKKFTTWADIYSESVFEGKDRHVMAALELVHAFPGQGVVSVFSFGSNFGAWQGLLEGHQIPHCMATVQRWQKVLLGSFPKGESKERAYQFVSRRYPHLGFKKGKSSEGVIDAICLALYARFDHTKQT